MKTYEATEQAYKNGYEQGKKDAEDEIQILKQKRANIFEILDAYERGRANALKWIHVTERLPERFVYVLVMTDFGEAAVARLKGNGRWYIGWDNDQYAGITHWMPLPEPPKGE